MADRRRAEGLDEAIESVMSHRKPAEHLDPRLASLLEVAGDLRGLARAAFKQRLATELVAAASGDGGPLRTAEEIMTRLAELGRAPALLPHDLDAALSGLPEKSMKFLAMLDGCTVGVARLASPGHWERHDGDELLHFLEGEADVVALVGGGPVRVPVRAGDVLVCPRSLWHKTLPRSPIAMLFATPIGTEASDAEDPPVAAQGKGARGLPDVFEARNVRAVLGGLPELRIGADTTAAEADAAFGLVAELDRCDVHVGRFHGQSPWERHSSGDELLHVLEGEVELTVLTDTGPVRRMLRAGSIFVCPRGLWHRQLARDGMTGIFATPKPTDVSFADDPRLGA